MKHVKLFEQFISEAKMPDKLIGNDEIVFLKTKEDSRGAHYNLYYKGHDIEKGGARFGSEKELKAFADDYILSNQWYNKLKYEDSKPLPESFVNERKASMVGKYDAPDYKELMDLLDMAKQYADDNLFRGKDFILYWADDRLMFDNVGGAAVGYDKRDVRKRDIFSGKKEVIHTFKKANYSPELTKKEVEKRSNGKISVEMAKWQGDITGVNYKFN